MPEITGIDHIYLAVCDLARSTEFYDRLMPILGFRKSEFAIGGDRHIQYYNRHFGFVLRPARTFGGHDPYSPGCIIFACASTLPVMSKQPRGIYARLG